MRYQGSLGEPSEEDIYQRAIRQPLTQKVERAVMLLKIFEKSALQLSDDGYYLCFSGGKDSIVLAKLAEMAGVEYTLNYNNVTIDPPELVRFIKRQYPQTIWHRSERKPLPLKMVDESQGPPTRLSRWCCEIYKEGGGYGLVTLTGVRAPESARRKGLWREVNNNKGGTIICPIVYWTDDDVWTFIRAQGLPYCELYDEGYKRLGCIGCPMSGPAGQSRDFKRWPRYERLWRKGFEAYWARWKGVPRRDGGARWIERMDSVDDLWRWWTSGKADEGDEPDCQMDMGF